MAGAELIHSRETKASCVSYMCAQGPKVLSDPPLLSQAVSTELHWKYNSWDMNQLVHMVGCQRCS